MTNGSNQVVGDGDVDWTDVLAGQIFSLPDSNTWYEIASVVYSTGAWRITLSSNYGEATAATVEYVIHSSFTPVYAFPYPEQGDVETASIFKRAMLAIESTISAGVFPTLTVVGAATIGGLLTINGTGNHLFAGSWGSASNTTYPGALSATGGRMYTNAVTGLTLYGYGTTNDFLLANKNGQTVLDNPTGTTNLKVYGNLTVSGTSTSSVAGVFTHPDGSTAIPSIAFTADLDTGIARAATNSLEIVAGATRSALFTATAVTVTGNLTASGTGTHTFGTTNTVTMSAGVLTTTGNANFGGVTQFNGNAISNNGTRSYWYEPGTTTWFSVGQATLNNLTLTHGSGGTLATITEAGNITLKGYVVADAVGGYVAGTFKRSSGNGTLIKFENGAASGRYNFFVGHNYNSTNTFEVIPSTAVDGATAGSTVLSVSQAGVLTVGTISLSGTSITFPNSACSIIGGGSTVLSFVNCVASFSNDTFLAPTKKLYLDSGSDTYIWESASDTMRFVTGGNISGTITAGSVIFNGNLTASGTGTHTFGTTDTVTMAAGVLTSTGIIKNNYLSLTNDSLNQYVTNATADVAISYYGYNGGTTQFRNLKVYDGKNALAFGIDGSTKAASFVGSVAVGGAAVSATTALIVPAGTTGISSLRIPHGAAPTSPVDGDMWTTTAGFFIRINGATVGPLS